MQHRKQCVQHSHPTWEPQPTVSVASSGLLPYADTGRLSLLLALLQDVTLKKILHRKKMLGNFTLFSVHVCLCVCVRAHTHVHSCVCVTRVEAGGQCWASPSLAFHTPFETGSPH